MTLYDDSGAQIWPPTLSALKLDAQGQVKDQEDVALQDVLDEAVDFVEDVRKDDLAFSPDQIDGCHRPPNRTEVKGTIRLALRWHFRRRALQGFVDAGDQGVQRIPSIDDDIQRMLKIGRYKRAATA